MSPTTPPSCASKQSMKPWSLLLGTTSSAANNSPRMGIRHQWGRNKRKFTIWSQYASLSVLTRRDTFSYWSRWGLGTTWSGMNILTRPHGTWIFWSVKKVGFSWIDNNLIMIIMEVEEAVNKWDKQGALFFSNDREAPREAMNKTQNWSPLGTGLL